MKIATSWMTCRSRTLLKESMQRSGFIMSARIGHGGDAGGPRAEAWARSLAVALLSGGIGLTLGWIGLVAYWAVHLLV
jgi:lipid-binding SYLF domain-containing protein